MDCCSDVTPLLSMDNRCDLSFNVHSIRISIFITSSMSIVMSLFRSKLWGPSLDPIWDEHPLDPKNYDMIGCSSDELPQIPCRLSGEEQVSQADPNSSPHCSVWTLFLTSQAPPDLLESIRGRKNVTSWPQTKAKLDFLGVF